MERDTRTHLRKDMGKQMGKGGGAATKAKGGMAGGSI